MPTINMTWFDKVYRSFITVPAYYDKKYYMIGYCPRVEEGCANLFVVNITDKVAIDIGVGDSEATRMYAKLVNFNHSGSKVIMYVVHERESVNKIVCKRIEVDLSAMTGTSTDLWEYTNHCLYREMDI